jgi:hypothetical protein
VKVDMEVVSKRAKGQKIPVVYNFEEKFGKTEQEVLNQNFNAIKDDITKLIEYEKQELKH